MENKTRYKHCLTALRELGAIKQGQFTLKSGAISTFYIDLRLVISSPKLLGEIGELLSEKVNLLSPDLVIGVPYTALFFATVISLKGEIPMIMRRKEKKEYGTQKKIEGIFRLNQKVIVIEDVVTSGASVLETISDLEEHSLIVEDVICVVDRESGGKETLAQKGYRLHSLFTLSSFLPIEV